MKFKPIITVCCCWLFITNVLYAQDSLVRFQPLPIDESIASKPFFTEGIVFTVDEVRFERDTNFFTVYLINNTDSFITLNSSYYYYDFKNRFLTCLSMQSLPGNSLQYKTILSLWRYIYGSHDVERSDTLFSRRYIKQKIKIACPGCSQENKQTVRLSLYDHTGWEFGKNMTYYSTPFQVYYHKQVFDRYNNPYYMYGLQESDSGEKEGEVREAFIVKRNASSEIKMAIEGHTESFISEKEINNTSSILKVYNNGEETYDYKVRRAIGMVINSETDAILHVFYVNGDSLDKEAWARIKKLEKGMELLFCNIEIEDKIGNGYFVGNTVYIIN